MKEVKVIKKLLWNFIYYIIHKILKPSNYFSFAEVIDGIFNYTYNPAFWFIYQLILLFVISPIIFLFYKKKKTLIAFLLTIGLFIIMGIDIPIMNSECKYGLLPIEIANSFKLNGPQESKYILLMQRFIRKEELSI